MPVSGPTVVRRKLGQRLKAHREAAGVTVEQVDEAHLGSRAKTWRIESGQVQVSKADVWALCRLYGVGPQETDDLAALAHETAEPGLWQEFRGVIPEWFKLYVGLETTASQISTFEDGVVPGELQTRQYAEALWRGARPDLTEAEIQPHLDLRTKRQEALFAEVPPRRLAVVLGENVLRRQVGGPEVMAAQLAHLTTLASLPTMDLRILPFASGAHPAVTGAFRILQFDDPQDPDVVYVELEVGAHYLEKISELQQYRRIYTVLTERSVPIGEFAG
jgi:transcriptional regulator with XRE-family HTH domain